MKAGDIVRLRGGGIRFRLRWVGAGPLPMAEFEYINKDGSPDRRRRGFSGTLDDRYELET